MCKDRVASEPFANLIPSSIWLHECSMWQHRSRSFHGDGIAHTRWFFPCSSAREKTELVVPVSVFTNVYGNWTSVIHTCDTDQNGHPLSHGYMQVFYTVCLHYMCEVRVHKLGQQVTNSVRMCLNRGLLDLADRWSNVEVCVCTCVYGGNGFHWAATALTGCSRSLSSETSWLSKGARSPVYTTYWSANSSCKSLPLSSSKHMIVILQIWIKV